MSQDKDKAKAKAKAIAKAMWKRGRGYPDATMGGTVWTFCPRCNTGAVTVTDEGHAWCTLCPTNADDLADALDLDAADTAAPLTITPLSAVQPRRQRWTWEGRIPRGEATLLAGPEGVGKSTFLAHLAAGLTRGTLEGDVHGQPQAVLIAALEDDLATTLRPRMEAAGADLSLVGFIEGAKGAALRLPEDLPAIRAELRGDRFPAPVGAVMVDPVKSTAPGVNPEREGEVRPLLAEVLAFAQTTGVSVILSAHFKKGAATEDFAAWKVSGSPAWTQLPRSVLFFGEDPDAAEEDPDARLIAHAKCNVGRRMPTLQARVSGHVVLADGEAIETSRLTLGGESQVRADDFGRADREERTAVAEAADFLAALLGDRQQHERATVLEAAKADGHAERTVKRAAKRLGVTMRRVGVGAEHRSVWSLGHSAHAGSSGLSGPSGPTGLSSPTQANGRSETAALQRARATQATQANGSGPRALAPGCEGCGAQLTDTPRGPVCIGCAARGAR